MLARVRARIARRRRENVFDRPAGGRPARAGATRGPPAASLRAMDDPATVPTALAQAGPRTLAVTWADGHQSAYDVRALRLACACAHCIDEWTGAPQLEPARVPEDVRPVRIQSVGRYAIQIAWSDGHESGIYPFRRLRALCPCPACRAAASADGPA